MAPPVLSAERIGEVWMVEEIEEISPELHGQSLAQFRVLGQRKIEIAIVRTEESIAW